MPLAMVRATTLPETQVARSVVAGIPLVGFTSGGRYRTISATLRGTRPGDGRGKRSSKAESLNKPLRAADRYPYTLASPWVSPRGFGFFSAGRGRILAVVCLVWLVVSGVDDFRQVAFGAAKWIYHEVLNRGLPGLGGRAEKQVRTSQPESRNGLIRNVPPGRFHRFRA
jgi:hypothetical protein